MIFSLWSGWEFALDGDFHYCLGGSFHCLLWMVIFLSVVWMAVFTLCFGWLSLCALDDGFPSVSWMVVFLWSGWRFTVCGLDFLSEVWMVVFSNCS